MSLLTTEQSAYKKTIAINPFSLTVTRLASATNSRGIAYEDPSATPSEIVFPNDARIVLTNKSGSKIVEGSMEYFSTKVKTLMVDFETIINKHDHFTYNGNDYEILDVVPITVDGGVRNYQAELRDISVKEA